MLGALLIGAGRVAAGVPGRGLTARERATLRAVFHDGLDLDTITVVPGRCGLLGLSRRPVTLGSTIYLKGAPSLLVHEAVHVWQYRDRGPRYVLDAIAAQWSSTGYGWRGATTWAGLNVEAQAQVVQELAVVGTDRPALAVEALAALRLSDRAAARGGAPGRRPG